MSESSAVVVAERYRLVRELGRGGMGRVWGARDELLSRDVAVKELVLPAGMAPEDVRELVERAIREARAIARVDHRNVVRIFDVLFEDERPWIVMELVESRSLFEVVSTDGPIAPEEVARIGLGVLAGLRAAHHAGVLHRDVKPANVLLGVDGRVVLTDFGLATASGDSSMTSTGFVLGSPSYLAPERTLDGAIGPAADLWSLGATLYAAVEGKPPYAKSSPMATLTALATEPPRPPEQAGVLGPALAALLEKDPERRADAETAERLLTEAAMQPTRPMRQPERVRTRIEERAGKRRARKRFVAIAAVLALLAVGIAARPAISAALASDNNRAAIISPTQSKKPVKPVQPPRTTPTRKKPTTKPAAKKTGRKLQNFQSTTCLYAPGVTGELELWACNPIAPQLFTFPSDGTMRVRGKCVAVEGLDNGAHLKLAACNGEANEQFSHNAAFDLVSGAANKCVDVPLGNPANAVPAQIWDCTGAGNQKWRY